MSKSLLGTVKVTTDELTIGCHASGVHDYRRYVTIDLAVEKVLVKPTMVAFVGTGGGCEVCVQ